MHLSTQGVLIPLALVASCGVRASTRSDDSVADLAATASTFHIDVLERGYLRGAITYRYVNRNKFIVGVGTCHTPHPPTVETLQGGEWKVTYAPAIWLCNGPPLLIHPQELHRDSLLVNGCLGGGSCVPGWMSSVDSAEARLVWTLYKDAQTARYSSELRGHEQIRVVSPPFRVVIRH